MQRLDAAALDQLFRTARSDRAWLNLGHGDRARLRPRSPRLDFDDACRLA